MNTTIIGAPGLGMLGISTDSISHVASETHQCDWFQAGP